MGDLEVLVDPSCLAEREQVIQAVHQLWQEYGPASCDVWAKDHAVLSVPLTLLRWYPNTAAADAAAGDGAAGRSTGHAAVPWSSVRVHCAVEQNDPVGEDFANAGGDADDAAVPSCRTWTLPCREFRDTWDALCYEDDAAMQAGGPIKARLLQYAATSMLFSDAGVSDALVSWNRLVLLHGPPGTGKTSLCRGLAQKLALRTSTRFHCGLLVEINAHSLFSRWFSESGKLVLKMFRHIHELVESGDVFVVVLIDEVESLSAARRAALAGSEPGDAIRVVNALLTQLDALRSVRNVLVVTTSNVTDAIDEAFLDRADLALFVGPPGARARYSILSSGVTELMRCGLVTPAVSFLAAGAVSVLADGADPDAPLTNPDDQVSASIALYHVAAACDQASGRLMRKLCFLAFSSPAQLPPAPCPYPVFLRALRQAYRAGHAAELQDASMQ